MKFGESFHEGEWSEREAKEKQKRGGNISVNTEQEREKNRKGGQKTTGCFGAFTLN